MGGGGWVGEWVGGGSSGTKACRAAGHACAAAGGGARRRGGAPCSSTCCIWQPHRGLSPGMASPCRRSWRRRCRHRRRPSCWHALQSPLAHCPVPHGAAAREGQQGCGSEGHAWGARGHAMQPVMPPNVMPHACQAMPCWAEPCHAHPAWCPLHVTSQHAAMQQRGATKFAPGNRERRPLTASFFFRLPSPSRFSGSPMLVRMRAPAQPLRGVGREGCMEARWEERRRGRWPGSGPQRKAPPSAGGQPAAGCQWRPAAGRRGACAEALGAHQCCHPGSATGRALWGEGRQPQQAAPGRNMSAHQCFHRVLFSPSAVEDSVPTRRSP